LSIASEFQCPGDVVLDRSPNHHGAFGLGPRRCIGDRLRAAGVERYAGNPTMDGVGRLPVTFTPGPSLGTSRPD
jgi:hypothetical protein